MFVARFVAATFGMVAERATLLRNKLRNKVAQQKSGVSSAQGASTRLAPSALAFPQTLSLPPN